MCAIMHLTDIINIGEETQATGMIVTILQAASANAN